MVPPEVPPGGSGTTPLPYPAFSADTESIVAKSNVELENPLQPQDIIWPASDDISADFISFFVVNDEAQVAPSFVYRKLADMYHTDDY